MALVAVTNGDTKKYVSDFDPAKKVEYLPVDPKDKSKNAEKERVETIDWEAATTFELGNLDVALMAYIYDSAMGMGASGMETGKPNMSVSMQINATNIEAVRFGLMGWTNFLDSKGKEVEFKKVSVTRGGKSYFVVAPECMERLDVEIMQELADQIKKRSRVTRGLEKNSNAA